MKTEVIMKRELFGQQIRQLTQSEFFCATDLVKAGNRWRMMEMMDPFSLGKWRRLVPTTDFVNELEKKYGKVISVKRGKNAETWVHPLIFIDIALAINPKLKVEVYEWMFDHLIANRNRSGDSYKIMCGYLYSHQRNKKDFASYISSVANQIKLKCGVTNWESATENQLILRNKIHNEIGLLADVLRDNDKAVHIALVKN